MSEYGDVWAIARPGRPGGGPRLAQKRGPYWKVDLALGSRTEVRESRVHELVAAAFLGPKPEWAECVRHLDDNPDNNHVSNLAYGTHADNSRDRIVNGRTVQAKLTDAQVAAIVADSRFQRVIAQDYGVSVSIISQIKRGVWSGQRRKETQ